MALGNHLMLAGLIFQIASLILFALACADFAIRSRKLASWRNPAYSKLRASSKFRGFLWAAVVSFITIFTRCIYRVVELGGGWDNSLMREETPFIILESWYVTLLNNLPNRTNCTIAWLQLPFGLLSSSILDLDSKTSSMRLNTVLLLELEVEKRRFL
jgi:hypothetical protein